MKFYGPYLLTESTLLGRNLAGLKEKHPVRGENAINTALIHLTQFHSAVRGGDLHRAHELALQIYRGLRNVDRHVQITTREVNAAVRLVEMTARHARRIDRSRTSVSRRTRWAIGLAARLLPSADRARYREEFSAELADLPRCDQAPYAFRLAVRAWSLRRSLTGKRSTGSTRVMVVVVAVGSAEGAVSLAGLSWPAAVLGCALVIALMWTVSSSDRTRHLASLIRAARGGPAPKRKA